MLSERTMHRAGTESTPPCADLLRVTSDDPAYRRMADAEAEFWRRPHPLGLETLENQTAENAIDRYINERFTGKPRLHWYDTIAHRQTFRRGVMLGTTAIKLEAEILRTNPDLHLTFIDISDGPLRRREDILGKRFPGRVSTRVDDLNFIDLSEQAYDVVISSGTVHHVTNLEYLGYQINRALTPDGWFFLQDYVGEPRFDASPAKKRVYETIYARQIIREPGGSPRVIWKDDSDLSPFCAVRSHDILAAMRAQLREVEVRTAAALVVPMLRSRPEDSEARLQRLRLRVWRIRLAQLQKRLAWWRTDFLPTALRQELCIVGDVASDAGLLDPGIAFAIYRKRAESQCAVPAAG